MPVPNPAPAHSGPPELPQLTERQELILSLIVREYIRNPQPVASKTLSENFGLNVSSATIRNEMAILEQYGLLSAPHTSAGRIPTQQGYRYFVRRLLTGGDLTSQERRRIAREVQKERFEMDEWLRAAAIVLARTAQAAALVTRPYAIENQFKHLELINTQGRLVLMVLVLHGGAIHQQVLTLAESVPQEVLSQTAQRLNLALARLTAEQVRAKTRTMPDALTREVGELVADALSQANQQVAREIYGYGLSESLPAFTDDEAQQAIRLLEEQSLLEGVLRETLTLAPPDDVHVVVAGEGRWENLSHLSVVLARYRTAQAHGAVGVLGPTRMRYGRAISAVRYVAGLMSDLLGDVYGESDPGEKTEDK